jgi:hypothetical protein
MIYIPCHVSHAKPNLPCHIIPCHISHTIWHTIALMASSSLPTYISHAISSISYNFYPAILLYHAISHMPYIMPYPSWHIYNYQHDIYPMPCFPHQTISLVTYYPIPHITCHLSYHLPRGISIITNMLYLACHISHVISYSYVMSYYHMLFLI